jgi:hypothetical protein
MKDSAIWATIPDWREKQHYQKGRGAPPWIKLHVSLLQSRRFQCLQLASKALAPQLWLLATRNDGRVNIDPDELAFQLRWKREEIIDGVKGLIANGYLICDSKLLARCYQPAIPETETETETETEDILSSLRSERISPPRCVGPSSEEIETAFSEFQALAVECGLPAPTRLTAARRKALAARLREHGPDGWRAALAAIRASPFLLGKNDRGWRADFDFAIQAKSCNKLIDGAFNATPLDRNAGADVENAIAAGFAAYSQRVRPRGG